MSGLRSSIELETNSGRANSVHDEPLMRSPFLRAELPTRLKALFSENALDFFTEKYGRDVSIYASPADVDWFHNGSTGLILQGLALTSTWRVRTPWSENVFQSGFLSAVEKELKVACTQGI